MFNFPGSGLYGWAIGRGDCEVAQRLERCGQLVVG